MRCAAVLAADVGLGGNRTSPGRGYVGASLRYLIGDPDDVLSAEELAHA